MYFLIVQSFDFVFAIFQSIPSRNAIKKKSTSFELLFKKLSQHLS